MKITAIIEKSFETAIVVTCPSTEIAENFLTAYWYNHYNIANVNYNKRMDYDNNKGATSKQSLADSVIKNSVNQWALYKENTCFNIREGNINPISLSYITKYGLDYPHLIIKGMEVERW